MNFLVYKVPNLNKFLLLGNISALHIKGIIDLSSIIENFFMEEPSMLKISF